MRFAGIGLLVCGGVDAAFCGLAERADTQIAGLIFSGMLFVSGAVFAAAAGIQDAIKTRH